MKKKGYRSKITVSDICSLAKINRSTFYRHYLDVDDLSDKLCLSLQEPCFKITNNLPNFVSSFLDIIEDNKLFFKYYFYNSHNQFNSPLFRQIWDNNIVPIFEKYGVHNESNMEYYFAYLVGGLSLILKKWIESDFAFSKDEISLIIMRCINNSPVSKNK